ncbi:MULTISPECIES: ABC transporter permease [unclassified Schlesneria]|uniref:ABC transporter permease n=1 Tax=Schlesneria TaxID=656899 RepID=UPI002EF14933
MSLPESVSSDPPVDSELIVVDADHYSPWFDLKELWRYRELVWIFAERDIKVRYRQTAVGIAWTILQPLAQMVVFTGLFRMLKTEPVEGSLPYQVTSFSGLLLYQLFSGILAASTACLVDNRQVVTKVYFPRLALPLSACLRPLLDFGIGMVVLMLLMLWFRVVPGPAVILAPFVVFLTVLCGLSIGLWLSALNAHYRDFGYVVPFMLQLGMVVSPVLYESSLIPSEWIGLYHLNPMAALLDSFRWTLFGTNAPHGTLVLISLTSLTCLLLSGAWYFRRVDRFLADSI